MKRVYCPYCGRLAEFVSSKEVYGGRDYGHMIYLCRKCNAYVGCHKGTDKPLGRLANAQLRYWKQEAHAAFDPIWKYGLKKRNEAYAWLASCMGLPVKKTHIGMFDVAQCKQVVAICKTRRWN